MRDGDRNEQGFDWDEFARACLGVLILLSFPFLTVTAHAQQASSASSTDVRRIEVGSDVTEAHTVFIQPELETTFVFRAPLAREGVELERRESFGRLEIGQHRVSFVPTANLKPETRLRLAVRFAGSTEPTGALFQLVVSSSRGERQVEVDRLHPSCETCATQLREAREETQRCKEAFQAERAGAGGADLLTGLIVSGRMSAQGIRAQDVALRAEAESPVKVLKATSFRSVDRVAARLEVQIPEGGPWRMEGAVLEHEGVEVPLKGWPSTPLLPGRNILVLEREAGGGELGAVYTLKVREAGGNRSVFIKQIDFP